MDTSTPVVAFNALGVNISSAKALIQEYDSELAEVEGLLAWIEGDKRKDEKELRSSKESTRFQLQRQIEDLWVQEALEVEQLEATFQARKAPLDERRRSIVAKIDEVKNTIAPIRIIPTEILGYIFRDVVSLGVAPWVLAMVNKRWRRTAMTTPWLWSTIRVDIDIGWYSKGRSKWRVDGISRSCHGNALVCRNLEDLAYFMEKSGVVPLDVHTYFNLDEYGWEVLQQLVGPGFSSRIESMSLYLDLNPNSVKDWSLGPFPQLRRLTCGSNQAPFVDLIMSQAHHLEELTAKSLSNDFASYRFWKTLRIIHMDWSNSALHLNKVLPKLRLIEVIKKYPRTWPDTDTPVVTLGHVKSISVACELRYLARLRLPQLDKLVWSQTLIQRHFFNQNLNVTLGPDWRLSFPNLIELEVRATGDAFALALKEMPSVYTAILDSIGPKYSKDLWAMDLVQSLAATEDMLGPRLRRLTLKHLKANKTFIKPLIRGLVVSRSELGIPFEHFEILWAKRSGKEDETVQYADHH